MKRRICLSVFTLFFEQWGVTASTRIWHNWAGSISIKHTHTRSQTKGLHMDLISTLSRTRGHQSAMLHVFFVVKFYFVVLSSLLQSASSFESCCVHLYISYISFTQSSEWWWNKGYEPQWGTPPTSHISVYKQRTGGKFIRADFWI